MKRFILATCSLALGLSALGSAGGARLASADTTRGATSSAGGAVLLGRRGRDREEVRRELQRRGAGTYIDEILAERDSALARWPDRHGKPLTVWVQPASVVADWSTEYVDSVRAAFAEWNGVQLPVHFAFTGDSAAADVHVAWIDHFDEPISGRTKWARDDDWWITDGDITLAVHHHHGTILEGDAMKAIALHEIGHLIGLDHTDDSGNIMAAKVRVRGLSLADVSTARLLYTLPPGTVR
jgi:predicted Zn-dependent protease